LARSSAPSQISYGPLTAPWTHALELFRFAGAAAPPTEQIGSGWVGRDGERVCGALLGERDGSSAMLHGPVVVTPPDAPPETALEVAAELLANALRHAEENGIDTVFTRPQGLDKIWVRYGFIPIPEAELPKGLRGRPGVGLYGWRGGTALWSAAGRNAAARVRAGARR